MNSPFRQQWWLLCVLQGFCEGRNRGCWETAFQRVCLTRSAHIVIRSTDSCHRRKVDSSLFVCVRTACSDSRHGFFHTLRGWMYHLVTSSLALEDSGPKGYLSSRLVMYYLLWVQGCRHSCTPCMGCGVICAQQVEAKAAGPLNAQKSFSGYRDSGKQPALKDFLFLEGADISSSQCCLPTHSAVS